MHGYDLTHHQLDVAIIGAGGAGLRAAIAASEGALNVGVIRKVDPRRSHTMAAQGGIVVAIREQLNIPVKLIGVGETPEDVEPFDPPKFIEALFTE